MIDYNALAGKIYNLLHPPITQEKIQEAYKEGLIPKKDLIDGQWYQGECRNASFAKWNKDKNRFEYLRSKFGDIFWEDIVAPEDDEGYDIFVAVVKSLPDPKADLIT